MDAGAWQGTPSTAPFAPSAATARIQQMKLSYITLIWAICLVTLAGFPTNTVSVAFDIANRRNTWADFQMEWRAWEDQRVTFILSQDGTAMALDGFGARFKLIRRVAGSTNTILRAYGPADVTVSGATVSFAVARTNLPDTAEAAHLASLELLDTGTNVVLTLATGKVRVSEGLYP